MENVYRFVAEFLTTHGVTASVEFPGGVCISMPNGTLVTTGITGWEFGSVSVSVGGMWDLTADTVEPDGLAQFADVPDEKLTADDARTIAEQWLALVNHGANTGPRHQS